MVTAAGLEAERCAQVHVAVCQRAALPGSSVLRLFAAASEFMLIQPIEIVVEFDPGDASTNKDGNLVAITSAWVGKVLNDAFISPRAFMSTWTPKPAAGVVAQPLLAAPVNAPSCSSAGDARGSGEGAAGAPGAPVAPAAPVAPPAAADAITEAMITKRPSGQVCPGNIDH